jgi:hypothetical protein
VTLPREWKGDQEQRTDPRMRTGISIHQPAFLSREC